MVVLFVLWMNSSQWKHYEAHCITFFSVRNRVETLTILHIILYMDSNKQKKKKREKKTSRKC